MHTNYFHGGLRLSWPGQELVITLLVLKTKHDSLHCRNKCEAYGIPLIEVAASWHRAEPRCRSGMCGYYQPEHTILEWNLLEGFRKAAPQTSTNTSFLALLVIEKFGALKLSCLGRRMPHMELWVCGVPTSRSRSPPLWTDFSWWWHGLLCFCSQPPFQYVI